MGWEAGKGIGKDLQGRVKPVEATVRKGDDLIYKTREAMRINQTIEISRKRCDWIVW